MQNILAILGNVLAVFKQSNRNSRVTSKRNVNVNIVKILNQIIYPHEMFTKYLPETLPVYKDLGPIDDRRSLLLTLLYWLITRPSSAL